MGGSKNNQTDDMHFFFFFFFYLKCGFYLKNIALYIQYIQDIKNIKTEVIKLKYDLNIININYTFKNKKKNKN